MKIIPKLIIGLVMTLFITTACEKENKEIAFTIFATHSDYDAFNATYVSIKSVTVDGKAAPWDFDLYSNIAVGETREIEISMPVENENVSVSVVSNGSGSGVAKEASTNGVENGDILYLDLGTSDFTNNQGISGNWERSGGASYLKFSGTSVYLCNGSSLQEFSGTYDAAANKAVLTEGSTTLTFYVYPEGSDKILVEQYVSDDHVGSEYYYSTTDYPCN